MARNKTPAHEAKSYDELKEIIDSQGRFVRAYLAGTPEYKVRIRKVY